MKLHYWTCSKFADWLRGTPKPASGISEEWAAWEKTARTKKIRYWVVENGLDYLEDLICWPRNRINDIRCYIMNRWIHKSHALTSNLKRGEWYDLDDRLLHAAFDELINFVEIEQAWILAISSEEDRKKYKTPWYRYIFRIGRWRCPEAGIDYLKWASELKNDEDWIDKACPDYGQPTSYALASQEIFNLYKWWKHERPKRFEPIKASGLSDYYEENPNSVPFNSGFIKKMQKDERLGNILCVYHKMKREQDEEDTAMLIRLVNIRHNLWT